MQTCKTDLDNLHALQYIVLRYGIPLSVSHVQTSASTALRSIMCSAQPYSTAPYSHGMGTWPRPQNPRNRAAAAPASQLATIQYFQFPDSYKVCLATTAAAGTTTVIAVVIYIVISRCFMYNCCRESWGRVHLAVSAGNYSSYVGVYNEMFLTREILHFTYYFRHVSLARNNDTVYIVAIRVLDELANHSRTLNTRSGEFLNFQI